MELMRKGALPPCIDNLRSPIQPPPDAYTLRKPATADKLIYQSDRDPHRGCEVCLVEQLFGVDGRGRRRWCG